MPMSDAALSLERPADVNLVRFDARDGLVPVIVQDGATGDVVMFAYANRPALELTLQTKEMHYFSRSRQALWHKGSTSGNVQRLRQLWLDCDRDAVLAIVDLAGPACHTGMASCFGTSTSVGKAGVASLAALWEIVEERAASGDPASYTVRLLKDANLRIKKLGEELAELVAAIASGERERVRAEAADLLYHLLVALRGAQVSLREVGDELAERMS